MKNIHEVLKRKEQLVQEKHRELQNLEKEIEALRAVVPMLRDDAEQTTGGVPRGAPSNPSVMATASGSGAAKATPHEPTSRWP